VLGGSRNQKKEKTRVTKQAVSMSEKRGTKKQLIVVKTLQGEDKKNSKVEEVWEKGDEGKPSN